MSEEEYHSPIAETVEASGNFINNVKNPLFVIVIILILFLGIVLYNASILSEKLVTSLQDIKSAVEKNNDLVIQGNNLSQKLIDIQVYRQNTKQ